MPRPRFATPVACALLALTLAASCATPHRAGHHHHHDEEPVELALLMSHMQRFSEKLGYAVDAENAPLADFYLHEVEETTEEIQEKVIEYEGLPIAATSRTILEPEFQPLAQAIEAGDWRTARAGYASLIDACNRCHRATDHDFIVIEQAKGAPPYNQRFTPDAP